MGFAGGALAQPYINELAAKKAFTLFMEAIRAFLGKVLLLLVLVEIPKHPKGILF
jgi:hypothetical protein